ncbi:hypothetical protein UYO_2343 [Lachnospiraceae bacterium JC7]|nr:hypothetical protein UYO_2343 [Lachnospiraceae bacterium JC7]
MQKKKWYEWLVALVFIAMVGLCVYLNVFSGQGEGVSNIAVNAAMFLIVAIILISCDRNSFAPINDIISDLCRVTAKIRDDAMNSHAFLYERYKENTGYAL